MEEARPNSSPHSLLTLPNELLLHTLSYLVDCPAALIALMRTCRRMHHAADSFLYHHVTLHTGDKAAAFAAALEDSNISGKEELLRARRKAVRYLNICAPSQVKGMQWVPLGRDLGIEKAVPCIAAMERLAELAIESPYCNDRAAVESDLRWVSLLRAYERVFEMARTGRALGGLRKCEF